MDDNGDVTQNSQPTYTVTSQSVVTVPITSEVKQSREGAPNGNTNAMKYPTPEDRQNLCKRFCDYLRTGKPRTYFPECDYDTISRYMKDFSVDFPPEDVEAAAREGQDRLLGIGYMGMTGKIDGFKEKTWQFIIQNMTNWKLRTDVTSDDKKVEPTILYVPTKVPEGSEE